MMASRVGSKGIAHTTTNSVVRMVVGEGEAVVDIITIITIIGKMAKIDKTDSIDRIDTTMEIMKIDTITIAISTTIHRDRTITKNKVKPSLLLIQN